MFPPLDNLELIYSKIYFTKVLIKLFLILKCRKRNHHQPAVFAIILSKRRSLLVSALFVKPVGPKSSLFKLNNPTLSLKISHAQPKDVNKSLQLHLFIKKCPDISNSKSNKHTSMSIYPKLVIFDDVLLQTAIMPESLISRHLVLIISFVTLAGQPGGTRPIIIKQRRLKTL